MEYEILAVTISYVLKHDNYHLLVVAVVDFSTWKLCGHCSSFYRTSCIGLCTYVPYLEIYSKRLIWFCVFKMLDDPVHCINCELLIFQYRDIADEVYHILQKHRPLVKPMTFVGQSSTGKQSKGFSQKQQLKVSKLGVSQFCLQMLQVCSLILSVLVLEKFCIVFGNGLL